MILEIAIYNFLLFLNHISAQWQTYCKSPTYLIILRVAYSAILHASGDDPREEH